MKVQVFYQEFKKNAWRLTEAMVYEPNEATLINEGNVACSSEQEACDHLFQIYNINLDNVFATFPGAREQMMRAGHSSMSCGDYIRFPDTGNVYICRPVGWELVAVTLVPVPN